MIENKRVMPRDLKPAVARMIGTALVADDSGEYGASLGTGQKNALRFAIKRGLFGDSDSAQLVATLVM